VVDHLVPSAPDSWTTLTLGELCSRGGGDVQTGPFGSQLHASDYVSVGVPSVMPVDIGDNRFRTENIAQILEKDAQRLARYRLRAGDIVYSRRGDVERRALVRRREDGWLCGTGCLRVRPGPSVNSEWLSYYLGCKEVRAWIVRHAVGATMPNLNTSILSALPVSLPPRPVQDGIAELLGALDDKVENNARVTSRAERLAVACLQAVQVRVPFGRIAEVRRSQIKVRDFAGADVEHYSLPAFDSGRVPELCHGASIKSNKFVLSGASVLISKLNPRIPRVWHAVPSRTATALASTEFVVLKPTGGVTTQELWAVAATREFGGLLSERVTGTTASHQRIRPEEVLEIPVSDPRSASSETRLLVATLVDRAAAARNENLRLVLLRDALLAALVSGRLSVREGELRLGEAV
jgi:type I restriction enzyme, S subunit